MVGGCGVWACVAGVAAPVVCGQCCDHGLPLWPCSHVGQLPRGTTWQQPSRLSLIESTFPCWRCCSQHRSCTGRSTGIVKLQVFGAWLSFLLCRADDSLTPMMIPGSPELSNSDLDMASKLFTFTFTLHDSLTPMEATSELQGMVAALQVRRHSCWYTVCLVLLHLLEGPSAASSWS